MVVSACAAVRAGVCVCVAVAVAAVFASESTF